MPQKHNLGIDIELLQAIRFFLFFLINVWLQNKNYMQKLLPAIAQT